jgi:molybdenum cofactor cytidylyltransferase
VIFAVVPAGGQSERMGTNKLLLPMAGRTVIECVVTALIEGGIQHVVVVTLASDVAGAAEAAGALICLLPQQTTEMRETVEHGLGWLEDRYHPRLHDAWLLAPADHPAIDAKTVRELCGRYPNEQQRTIVVPAYRGKRGHPVLLAWHHFLGIRQHPPNLGLDSYLRLHADQIIEVPIDNDGILKDIDTPQDYARLHNAGSGGNLNRGFHG